MMTHHNQYVENYEGSYFDDERAGDPGWEAWAKRREQAGDLMERLQRPSDDIVGDAELDELLRPCGCGVEDAIDGADLDRALGIPVHNAAPIRIAGVRDDTADEVDHQVEREERNQS
jgi:hypothetical protein